MVTWKNYEEYMVMHADGELTPVQEQDLMSFLYEHPELQSELTAFTMTKMIPDATETYTRMASLLKPEPIAIPVTTGNPKVIALPTWRRYAVAAGVAALLFASGYSIYTSTNNNKGNTNPITATTTRPATTAPVLPTPSIPVQTPTATVPQVPQPAVAATKVKRTNSVTRKNTGTSIPATAHEPVEYAYATTAMERIPATEVKQLKAEQKNIAPAVTNVPALAIQYREDDTKDETANSFIDRLPVSDTKKAGMKSLATDAADQYGMVNSIRKEIANANVSVTLKNKKLTFSF